MAERLFTRAEAQELLERVRPLVERGRVLAVELARFRAQTALRQLSGANGGGRTAKRIGAAEAGLRAIIEELTGLGLVYRDPAQGLLDFPATVEGQPAFLCWRLGEDGVDWWHDRDSGFAGRRRLDQDQDQG